MISEVIPSVEPSNHDNHDNNKDNESTTPFAENILSSNFKDCNNFAVFKHKSEKFLDGTCRKKVLKCDLRGRYTQKLLRLTSDKMTMKGSKKQAL
ncbi:hypothetical protein RhiirB3_454134 [Rhizophagus irregularis]|nr:hypothetical protein RhiirB3_454134 [Rhizophagus irregularis]